MISIEKVENENSIEIEDVRLSTTLEPKTSYPLPTPNDTSNLDIPPDGGKAAWMVVFASFLIHFITLGNIYSFGVYQNYYNEKKVNLVESMVI